MSEGGPDGPIDDAALHAFWFPADEPSRPRVLRRELADELRGLLHGLATLDTDLVDPDLLADTRDRLAALRARLDDQPHHAHGPASARTLDRALTERSPMTGRANPLAPPLTFVPDGEITRATAVFDAAYEGPPGAVHGGVIAAIFDEIVGVAQLASRYAGVTGTLTVRYRTLTPLHTRIDYEAGVGELDGRKLRVWATSSANATVTAEAEAIMVIPAGAGRDWATSPPASPARP